MKKIIIIISSLILITILVCVGFYEFSVRLWKIKNDTAIVTFAYTAFDSVVKQMADICDETDLNQLNIIMDGNVHYLHEIDEKTTFGELLLNQLKNNKGEYDCSGITSFEDYESLIKTKVPKKEIAICYKEGYIEIYIPNSNWNPRLLGEKKEIKVRSEFSYINN